MTPPRLRLEGVSVRLGGVDAVRDVSAEADAGEIVAIVGRNGAGKTSVLRAAAGLSPLHGGRVAIDGAPLAGLSARERAARLAFVSQRPLVSAAFSVREVVTVSRFALPRDDRRVAEALARFGLDEFADRDYHALSVGQQQRVSLARAWAQASPTSILFLDEPFASMDLGESARSLAIVRGHAERGGLVLAVVHDLAIASALATRVWIMETGRLIADGPAAAVLDPLKLEGIFGVPFASGPQGPVPRLGGA